MNTTVETLPLFSVVIPTKNNKGSVAETVKALLSQDYPLPPEIIVVGDRGDSAWEHLRAFGNRVTCIATDITSPGRDSNMKRAIGLEYASIASGVLAVMDDDVIPAASWMSDVAERLQGDVHAAAGPVSGLGNSFWTRYIDQNPAASKMPRIANSFMIDSRTLKRRKPPVTANFVITRRLYEAVGGPNPAFTNSYEDYSWMSIMIQHGYGILCDEKLACQRYHREGLKPLMREYLRSGKGCADLIAEYRNRCVFARKRARQLRMFYASAIGLAAAFVFAPLVTIALGAGASAVLTAVIMVKVRRWEAAIYPYISLLLGGMFIIGLSRRLAARETLVMPVLHGAEILRPGCVVL